LKESLLTDSVLLGLSSSRQENAELLREPASVKQVEIEIKQLFPPLVE
jgi:hypothetical protein